VKRTHWARILNTQSNTIIHKKTQTDVHGQEQQLNKEAPNKYTIQQILFQIDAYTRKRSVLLGEPTIGLGNGARDTGTIDQIAHNTQKTNVNASWKEVSDKKRNRNSPEMSTLRKQLKMNRYEPNPWLLLTPSWDLTRSTRTRAPMLK
jgi:hypothetical protein